MKRQTFGSAVHAVSDRLHLLAHRLPGDRLWRALVSGSRARWSSPESTDRRGPGQRLIDTRTARLAR